MLSSAKLFLVPLSVAGAHADPATSGHADPSGPLGFDSVAEASRLAAAEVLLDDLPKRDPSYYTWKSHELLTVRNQHDWGEPLANTFARLPASASKEVRSIVYELGVMAAGVQVAFTTDAPEIAVDWQVGATKGCGRGGTVPLALCSSPDLYTWDDATRKWHWAATALNTSFTDDGTIGTAHDYVMSLWQAPEFPARPAKPRSFLLNLPMYNRVLSLAVGVPAAAAYSLTALTATSAAPADAKGFDSRSPIVWYGTSILHGAAASRAGMAHSNIVSRELGIGVLNYGFSGNGIMETSVAQYLVRVNASALIVDCLPNMYATDGSRLPPYDHRGVREHAEPFVRFVRAARPELPIILAEGTPYGDSWLGPAGRRHAMQLARRKELRAAYERLTAAGVPHLHYFADDFFAAMPAGPPWQPTEGGTHPSDLGMASMAEAWLHYLPTVVKGLAPYPPAPPPAPIAVALS